MHTQSLARRAIGVFITVGVLLVPTALASPARADRIGPAVSLDAATRHRTARVGKLRLSPSTGLAHRQPVRIRARHLPAGLTVYLHECEGSGLAAHPLGPCDAQLGGPIVVDAHGRIDVTVAVLRYFAFYDGVEYDCAFEGCSLSLGIGAVDDTAITTVALNFAMPNPVPKVSIDSTTVVEGTGGVTTAQLRLHLDRPATGPVVLFLRGVDATATHEDYDVESLVSIPIGTTEATVGVYIVADSIHEGTEVFGVAPRSLSGATFGDGFPGALVIIADDD